MTCSRCRVEFCWSCGRLYSIHTHSSCSDQTILVGFWWLVALSAAALRLHSFIPPDLIRCIGSCVSVCGCLTYLVLLVFCAIGMTAGVMGSQFRLPLRISLSVLGNALMLYAIYMSLSTWCSQVWSGILFFFTLFLFISPSFLYLFYSS